MPNFLEIYELHNKLVFNLCLQYLQNKQDAEEATQDIFVKIHHKLPTFEGKSSLKTWIYRISINQCLDVVKARKRHKRFGFLLDFFSEKIGKPHDLPHFEHPGVLLEDRDALENLFKKINQLPENQRTALILKYLDDLPQREIAEIMSLSEKAVESLLQRAKHNLEKRLGNKEGF
jgi:RNA polymerase sigma factor (sigma-70 family)